MGILTTLVREVVKNNSERPVDALAENGILPTHLLTTSNQEMLAHLKIEIPYFCGAVPHLVSQRMSPLGVAH